MPSVAASIEPSITSSRAELRPISSVDEIVAVWPRVAPLLEGALAYGHGELEKRDVLDGCTAGDMQLWFSDDSFVVTEIRAYPRTMVCRVFLAGGNLATIKRHIPDMKHWAWQRGCVAMEVVGRPGWERALGFEKTAVILRIEI